jgi:hypothetical protein
MHCLKFPESVHATVMIAQKFDSNDLERYRISSNVDRRELERTKLQWRLWSVTVNGSHQPLHSQQFFISDRFRLQVKEF